MINYNLTFEGMNMQEFIEYLRENDTFEFNNFYLVTLDVYDENPTLAKVTWWNTMYDEYEVTETVAEFFENMN